MKSVSGATEVSNARRSSREDGWTTDCRTVSSAVRKRKEEEQQQKTLL
jgi:hypothetical protein